MSAKASASFDDDEGRRWAPICNMSHARHITRRNLCLLCSSDLSMIEAPSRRRKWGKMPMTYAPEFAWTTQSGRWWRAAWRPICKLSRCLCISWNCALNWHLRNGWEKKGFRSSTWTYFRYFSGPVLDRGSNTDIWISCSFLCQLSSTIFWLNENYKAKIFCKNLVFDRWWWSIQTLRVWKLFDFSQRLFCRRWCNTPHPFAQSLQLFWNIQGPTLRNQCADTPDINFRTMSITENIGRVSFTVEVRLSLRRSSGCIFPVNDKPLVLAIKAAHNVGPTKIPMKNWRFPMKDLF